MVAVPRPSRAGRAGGEAAGRADDDLEHVAATQVGARVPGLVLVAVDADGVVFTRSWGVSDISSGDTLGLDTACNWFSMTKLLTATIAVQLSERGLLDLDAPVDEYYAAFSIARPAARARSVTARQLLDHSSGLTNPLPLRWVHLACEEAPAREPLVRRLLEQHPRIRTEPGTRARYTNLGYLVLGEVLTAAAGRPFEVLVADLLATLRMRHTGLEADPATTWATPYQRRRTPINAMLPLLVPRKILGPNHGSFRSFRPFYLDGAAYGGLVGPVVDAARFLRAHLRDGELDGTTILATSSARRMRTMSARGKKLEVGLGWIRRGTGDNQAYVEHLGGGAGFWNCMRLYPEVGLGFVCMGNATTYDHDRIVRAALGTARSSLPPRS